MAEPGRCATCRWWAPAAVLADAATIAGSWRATQADLYTPYIGWGYCEWAASPGEGGRVRIEGRDADLLTAPDFGCVDYAAPAAEEGPMAEPLSEQALAEIEARAAAATPGPWRVNPDAPEVYAGELYVDGWSRPLLSEGDWEEALPCFGNVADAVFVAHARADVPALLAEVRRLRAVVAHGWRP